MTVCYGGSLSSGGFFTPVAVRWAQALIKIVVFSFLELDIDAGREARKALVLAFFVCREAKQDWILLRSSWLER